MAVGTTKAGRLVRFEPRAKVKVALALVQEPKKIQGFITALPLSWTAWENNLSGFNLTVIAMEDSLPQPTLMGAATELDSTLVANTVTSTGGQAV